MDKSLILKRLKDLKNFNTDKELADFLGISKSTLSNWGSRNSIDYDILFSKCEQEDLNYLIKGIEEESKNEIYTKSPTLKLGQKLGQKSLKTKHTENVLLFKSEDFNGVLPKGAKPFFNLPVSAGRSLFEIMGINEPDGFIYNLPGMAYTENFLPVVGYSMEPEVKENAIIGVRKMDKWETLNTTKKYLIITHDDRMIKYIEHDENNDDILWCVSPNFKRFKIYKSEIIEVQRITFVINPE